MWTKLRKDLAVREFEDLRTGKIISKIAFKQRVAQLLTSYSIPGPGEQHSYLQKLVRGMPAGLEKCKENKYGPCGKHNPQEKKVLTYTLLDKKVVDVGNRHHMQ